MKPPAMTRVGDVVLLVKPSFGAACNGCGHCCAEQVCGMGLEAFGDSVEAPCPALRFDGSRNWCAVIEQAERMNVAFAADLKWRLGVGAGCQMSDEHER